MRYFVYILQSEKTQRYYIGHTDNIKQRLTMHNRGSVRSTKGYRPWRLAYTEEYASRKNACRRERELKRKKSHALIKKLCEE